MHYYNLRNQDIGEEEFKKMFGQERFENAPRKPNPPLTNRGSLFFLIIFSRAN